MKVAIETRMQHYPGSAPVWNTWLKTQKRVHIHIERCPRQPGGKSGGCNATAYNEPKSIVATPVAPMHATLRLCACAGTHTSVHACIWRHESGRHGGIIGSMRTGGRGRRTATNVGEGGRWLMAGRGTGKV